MVGEIKIVFESQLLVMSNNEMSIEIDPTEAYHRWYYDTEVWHGVTFLGVP